jgi:hypothetical protein
MPDARDLAELSLVINPVHNSIRTKDDFAKDVIFVLGHNAT